MVMTDAMVGSRKPCLQMSEDEVDARQLLFGNLGIAAFGDGEVIVATRGEAGITTPVISDDLCAGRNRSLTAAAKRLRATVRDNGEPDTPGIPPALALVERVPGVRWRISTAVATRTLSWTPRPFPRVRPPT
jgi:hypothetical protein